LTLIAYLPDDDNHKSEIVPAIWPPVTVEKSRVSSKETERERQIEGENFT